MQKILTTIVAALILAGAMVAAEAPAARQEMAVGNGTEPVAIDPHVTNGIPELRVQRALFEGLLQEAPDGGEPLPGVAERWEVSADGRVYVFHLRADAKWSNGEPLTAEDFVWSLRRATSPGLANPYAYLYALIAGGEARTSGASQDAATLGVRAVAERTLEIRLVRPVSHFTRLLAHNAFFPVHRATVEAAGPAERRATGWDSRPGMVSNGPFRLEEWSVNRHIITRRNPYYWDAAATRLEVLRFVPAELLETEERMFAAGELQATYDLPPAKVEVYRRARSPALRIDPFQGVYYFTCNVRRPPLDDPRVRRALSLALDRQAIVDNVTRAGEQPAFSFVVPGADGYVPGVQLQEDAAEARRLLAAAGFPGGRGFPPLEFIFNTNELHRMIAEAVQQMWKRELGIEITLTNQEWKVFLSRRFSTRDFQLSRSGWIGIYDDPAAFLEILQTGAGNNDSQWSDPGFDELVHRAQGEPDRARRHELYRQAEQRLLEAMPVIPLYFYTRRYLLAPEVRGWVPHKLDRRPWQRIWLAAPRGMK